MFKKSYDQIIKVFTKVEKDLRELADRESAKAVKLSVQATELKLKATAAADEVTVATHTADKLAEFFSPEED